MGGGIFSKFMTAIQCINHKIRDIDSIESIYLGVIEDKKLIPKNEKKWYDCLGDINPFDFVLEQDKNIIFNRSFFSTPHAIYNDIIRTNDLNRLRKIVSKIKIKDSVLNKINPGIDEETLGVHIRLTDMDEFHQNNSNASLENFYTETVNIIKKENNLNKIFVASDNESSLEHFNNKLDIIYNGVCNRSKNPKDSEYQMQLQFDMVNSEEFWVDSFLDMLSLSKCGDIICRVSNLNNASISFNGDKNVHKL